nr:MAG TPA: hypothetical protein [Caudoviricetes sp.]
MHILHSAISQKSTVFFDRITGTGKSGGYFKAASFNS